MTIGELIEKFDGIFSEWTRLRFADWKGDVHCYTCTAILPWRHMDAGHFIRRAIQLLRFDPDNVRPQCPDCNRQQYGKQKVFEEELRWEVGDKRVDEMKRIEKRNAPSPYDKGWLEQQIIHYQRLVKNLKMRV